MNEKTKDILIRAGKTFWQAALAYLLADAAVLQEALTDWSTGKAAPALACRRRRGRGIQRRIQRHCPPAARRGVTLYGA